MTPWKLASSIILSSYAPKNIFNYKLLLLQRTSTTSSFANALVFPGGTLDPADFSIKLWGPILNKYFPERLNIFGKKRLTTYNEFEKDYLKQKSDESNSMKCLNFKAETIFRLCALRETFEETGILLAQTKDGERVCISSEQLYESSQTNWQLQVKDHPESFAELYNSLDLAPDITGLCEWSGWLSPFMKSMNQRFDTVFYFATLPRDHSDINITQDHNESVAAYWKTPADYLALYNSRKFNFMPPQVYELGRLCRFQDLDELKLFSAHRANLGSERWTPIIYFSEDGSTGMGVYPGDQRYPSENIETMKPLKVDTGELKSWIEEDITKNRTIRISHNGTNDYLDVNVNRLGHKLPLTVKELDCISAKL